ncbi:MAG TPA: hypothetical protein VKT71_06510 [Candidatus Acidoferrales bacterium]|nr:hypothetical protein [Candidatus Acidoferrales bacterium]
MGIGFVLLFWAALGSVLAALGALTLGCATAYFTRGVKEGRRKAVILTAIFPFVCLGWCGAVFVFQAVVNGVALQRDPGLGDDWHCPLPNGYALMMIDVTDHGVVYNPKTQGGRGGVGEQKDAIFGVRIVQVAGRYIFGGIDSKADDEGEARAENERVDSYFFIDTLTGARLDFAKLDDLRDAAVKLGIQPNLEPIEDVYRRYRFTMFDLFTAALLLVPPIVAAGLLLRWIVKVRKRRETGIAAA